MGHTSHALASAAAAAGSVHVAWWAWIFLVLFVLGLAALDTFVLNRSHFPPTIARAAVQSAGYVVVSVIFGGVLWMALGSVAGQQFFTAYSLEMTLSFDNVFAWSLIIGSLVIYRGYHQSLLAWGVALSIALRGILLVGAGSVIQKFAVAGLLMAAILGYTVFKLAMSLIKGEEDEGFAIEESRTYKLCRRFLPMTEDMHGTSVATRQEGGWIKFTPMFVAVAALGFVDVVFATDSIPAVLAVSLDLFVIVASVMMAVTCLKSLYFLYDAVANAFSKVSVMLVFVLGFICVKMVIGNEALASFFHHIGWTSFKPVEVNPLYSLGVVLGLVSAGIVWSLVSKTNEEPEAVPVTMEEELTLDPPR